MTDRPLLIRHPDGREYGVLLALYQEQYKSEGFAIVGYLDGTPYPDTDAAPVTVSVTPDEPPSATAIAGPTWP